MGNHQKRGAWNKGRLIGQNLPLKPKDILAIRIHLQNAHAVRDLAMFNLAIDSKLRGCDLVNHCFDFWQIFPRNRRGLKTLRPHKTQRGCALGKDRVRQPEFTGQLQ